MPILSDARGLLRFASALPGFLKERISPEEAAIYVRERMQTRDSTFLQMVEEVIYDFPASPYLRLLRAAGIELGDVRELVRQEGVEGTLQRLQQAGVYVSFEEFKGRTPAVRGSETFLFGAEEFDNPLVLPHFRGRTGGTGGRATSVPLHLDHIAQSAPHWAVWFAAHRWSGRPLMFWTPVYAAVAVGQLRYAKIGAPFVRWFSMGTGGSLGDWLTGAGVHGVIRWAAGFPKAEFVPLDRAWEIADHLFRMVQEGSPPLVNASPSAAARIGIAALERGLSLRNVSFLLRGEPLTAARRATIEESGAEAVQTYGFSEGGTVGCQCPHPTTADDVHVFMDAFAVIGHSGPAGGVPDATALLLTALRPACPKVMLNTEIGDYAVIKTRECSCLLGELGYSQHLGTIRSFAKLTGEGVTFVGSDIFHVLEDILPHKFGGSVTDYQLVETQDSSGLARYRLLVSPDVGAVDEVALVDTFLKELGRMKGSYRLMARLWEQGRLLQVDRQPPMVTARGKVLPFYTVGRA